MLKQTAREALILFVISIGVALIVYWARPDKIEMVSSTENIEDTSQGAMAGQIPEISLKEAVQRFKEGAALFVDARNKIDFEAGHIQGAVNLVLDDKEIWLPDFLVSTDPATSIITYCDGEECHLAPDLAEFLFFNGFDQVHYLKNGWSLWREGEHPVIK